MKADFYLFSHYKIKKNPSTKKEYINMVLVNPMKNNQMHYFFFAREDARNYVKQNKCFH